MKSKPTIILDGDEVAAARFVRFGLKCLSMLKRRMLLPERMGFEPRLQGKRTIPIPNGGSVFVQSAGNHSEVTIFMPLFQPGIKEEIEEEIELGELIVLEMAGKIWKYRDDPEGSDTDWAWYEEAASDFRKITVYDTVTKTTAINILTNDDLPAVFPIDYDEVTDWLDSITDIGESFISVTRCPEYFEEAYSGARPWPAAANDPDVLEQSDVYNCYNVSGVLIGYYNTSLMHYAYYSDPVITYDYNHALDYCGTCGPTDPDECDWVLPSCTRSLTSLKQWTDTRPRMYADALLDVYQPYQISFINSGDRSSFSRYRQTVNSVYDVFEESLVTTAYDCGQPWSCYLHQSWDQDTIDEIYEDSTYTIETPLGTENLLVEKEYERTHNSNLVPTALHSYSGGNDAVTLADRYTTPRAWNTSILASAVCSGEGKAKLTCQLYVQRHTKEHTVTPDYESANSLYFGVPENGSDHMAQWIVIHGSIVRTPDIDLFNGVGQPRVSEFEAVARELIDTAYVDIPAVAADDTYYYLPEWTLAQVRIVE